MTAPRLGPFGHPSGLWVLFFVEMWERFSYYGNRALLVLYMTAPQSSGGLGFSDAKAGFIYGLYTWTVYALALPGGYVADRWMGYRRAVLIGGVILAIGHFSLAFSGLAFFFGGLSLIAIGTGLLKTNCTSIVGLLYDKDDVGRRDAGYTIYYIGINIGAFAAPLVVGFMAQDPSFLKILASIGLASKTGWHWGFGVAGVAMLLGLSQYLIQQRVLGDAGKIPGAVERKRANVVHQKFTREEWQRIGVIIVLFIFATFFWATFEQAGTTLNLFADRLTDNRVLGFSYPSTWFQSVNSLCIIFGFGAGMAWLWQKLGKRAPSSPVKFAIGLFLVGAGMALLIPPSAIAASGTKVGPQWLLGTYIIHTIGELCLSPIGQSMTSRIAPHRVQGLMMGVWFMSLAFGNLIAGNVGGLFSSIPLTTIFATIFAITTGAAIAMLLLKPMLNRWTGDKPETPAAH